MAARGAMMLAMAVFAVMAMAAEAEVDCSAQLNAMQSCIEYVNSNTSAPPTRSCCAAFNATQVTMPVCLCQLQQAFSDPANQLGNATRANQIPTLCAVAVDPSRCPALLGLSPVPAPRISPIATPAIAPVVAPTSPGAGVDCSAEIDSLADCITFVSSNATAPPATCCASLLNVHTNKPVCLCQLLQLASDPSQTSGLNVTKALELPTTCKVSGASADSCPALLGQPVASPVDAPVASVPEAATVPDTGAPGTPGAPGEESPAVSEPNGNDAASSSSSMLLAAIALALHLLL